MTFLRWIEGFSKAMVGWRKFVIAMTALLGATYLCAIGQLESAGYVTSVLGVLGLFGLANVAGKYAPNAPSERS